MMMEMKDKVSLPWRSNNRLLIRQPVWTSCGGLCWTFQGGSEVVSAMRLFLPKRTSSSSASSCPRPGPTQQTAKSTPTAPGPRPPDAHAWHDATLSRSAKDPCPRSYWFRRLRNPPEQPGRKRRGPESSYRWTNSASSLYCVSRRTAYRWAQGKVCSWILMGQL